MPRFDATTYNKILLEEYVIVAKNAGYYGVQEDVIGIKRMWYTGPRETIRDCYWLLMWNPETETYYVTSWVRKDFSGDIIEESTNLAEVKEYFKNLQK